MGEEIRKKIEQQAEQAENRIEECKGKVKALLLGPGYPEGELETRLNIKDELEEEGFQIFVMENLPNIGAEKFYRKFEKIISEVNPELIICILTEEGAPHGVIFEVGYICGHNGFKRALSRVKFCIHNNLNKIEVIPRYLEELMVEGERYDYYDDEDGRRLVDRVRHIIRNEIVRLYNPPSSSE